MRAEEAIDQKLEGSDVVESLAGELTEALKTKGPRKGTKSDGDAWSYNTPTLVWDAEGPMNLAADIVYFDDVEGEGPTLQASVIGGDNYEGPVLGYQGKLSSESDAKSAVGKLLNAMSKATLPNNLKKHKDSDAFVKSLDKDLAVQGWKVLGHN